jgi:hypothetical protein
MLLPLNLTMPTTPRFETTFFYLKPLSAKGFRDFYAIFSRTRMYFFIKIEKVN